MRLAQLARKLGVKPADIQAFLAEKAHDVELNPNARLSDEQLLVVVRHMNPSLEAGIFQEPATVDAGPVVSEVAEPVAENEVAAETPVDTPTREASADPATETEIEVIRAPKMELPGLKVVGKIELKEPKKKTEEPLAEGEPGQEGEPKPAAEPRQERRLRDRQSPTMRRQAPPRQWNNPLEVQRQREAAEREEKRQREIELEKQRRTQKYLKKVKSVPTKPVRRQDDEYVEVEEDTRPAPKTWLGKLARWLTT